MNNVFAALVVGLVAGVGGALTLHLLGGMSGGDDGDGASVDLAPIEQRLGTIERELQAIRNPPETLTSPAMREGARTGAGAALPGGDEAVESLLAKIDERVGKTVERKFEEMKAGDDEKKEGRNARPERRRVSLARAAQELELTGQQEDELRRIYQESQDKVFALLAKPDGDPEEVKREIMEAVGTPEGTGKVIGKYMPKVMGSLGEFIGIQTGRRAAINKALGPEKAERLRREYSIEEDDILNLQTTMRMDMGARRGR